MNDTNLTIQFFWQKGGNKNRFNLLLLEYGEHFYEDVSVYCLPLPSSTRTIQQCDSLKVQGRLKVCSRSLIFEPNDITKPIVRYCFKNFTEIPKSYSLPALDLKHCMFETSGFISYACSSIIEMKVNNKIAPYKQVDEVVDNGRVLFSLLHSDAMSLISKVDAVIQIYNIQQTQGVNSASKIKLPYNTTAITSSFDTSLLVDFHETLLLEAPIPMKKVSPMVLNPGSIMITDRRIYYIPANINNVDETVQTIEISKIQRVYCRRYLLRPVGLELLMRDGVSWLFCFEETSVREHVYALINEHPRLNKKSKMSLADYTAKWQKKEITNFEYLMYLNYEADRSVNDITQYPVFPHVIQDYTSKSLDLKSRATYRDLSLPVGALNPSRLAHFRDRFRSMPECDESMGIPPPFMYGTHYSTPGYVLYYLVRVAPEHMLCLQAGKFDSADRMFSSIADSWDSCYVNPADLKELVPEFFYGSGDFLLNKSDLDMGYRQTGERLGDVELPPWAKSPKDFIKKNNKAIESSYVSEHLNDWIDLIFGYKQRGQAAVDADNVFYHLTYEGSVDLESIKSARERHALEIQIQEFGQTPKQLFTSPHPKRSDKPSKADKDKAGNAECSYTASAAAPVPLTLSASDRKSAPSKESTCGEVSTVLPSMEGAAGGEMSAESSARIEENFTESVRREVNDLTPKPAHVPGTSEQARTKQTSAGLSSDNSNSGSNVKDSSATPTPIGNTGAPTSSGLFNSAVSNIYNFFGSATKKPAKTPVSNVRSNGGNNKHNNHNGDSNAAASNTGAKSFTPLLSPGTAPSTAHNTPMMPTSPTPIMTMPPVPPPRENNSPSPVITHNRSDSTSVDQGRQRMHSTTSNLSTHSNSSTGPGTGGRRSKRAGEIFLDSGRITQSNSHSTLHTLSVGAGFGLQDIINFEEFDDGMDIPVMQLIENETDNSEGVLPNDNFSSRGVIPGIRLIPLDSAIRTIHSQDVCGISVRGDIDRKTVCTCSQDGYVKVVHLELDTTLNTVKYTVKRTFSTSLDVSPNTSGMGKAKVGSSMCRCVLLAANGKCVLGGSTDSRLYSFSIPNASIIGDQMLHDDSISCIVSNRRGTLLVTGAIDASIKLWKLGSGSGVLLSPLPIVELFEHDQAIACLSLNPESDNSDGARKISGTEDTCYLAAGAEDGVLILWDIGATVPGSVNVTASAEQPLMLFSCQVSQTKNPISGIVWVPLSESKCGAEHPGYPIPKLVCSTVDGSLMCLDVTGKLIVGTRMEVGIYCIAIDTRASGQDGGRESSYIYAGCSDGSLRAWAIENNSFVEKFRGDHAHTCTVNGKGDIIDIPASACHSLAHTYSVITSMAVCKEGSYLITGADDGSLRTWRIE